MPALDSCHQEVVRALEKDGWHVKSLPKYIDTEERTIFIDIEASKTEDANTRQIMFVEVKCFQDENRTTQELYTAIGQYLIYRAVLNAAQEDVPLYLSVPKTAYEATFDIIVKTVISENQIKLVIVDLASETIEAWLE